MPERPVTILSQASPSVLPPALFEQDIVSPMVQDVPFRPLKNGNVRITERVDRLLRITHDEQIAGGQCADKWQQNVILQLVGVLVLVHHDVAVAG